MTQTGWALAVFVCVGLVGLTVATYWPVVTCSFVNFDDLDYVFRNHNLLAGFSWSGWKYAWTSFVCSNWHPLTILSLGLDNTLWGLNPLGYHVENVAIHCADVLLLFLVLNQMTQQIVPSAVVAALFALHPLHVESVAWVSERKDVLSTFFLLLTIGAYVKYASRPSLLRYSGVFVLMLLGLLAKPMLVTLPVLLLLLDAWPLKRIKSRFLGDPSDRFPPQSLGRLMIEKIPLLGLSLADSLVTLMAQETAKAALPNLTLDTRIAHMFYAYSWYLEKTFIPINLIVYYPHPQRTLPWISVGIGVLTFLTLSVLVVWQWRARPHLAFGWCWFVISLLPVIGIIQVGTQAYADRYVYIPHIGLFMAIVWELFSWFEKTRITRIIGDLGIVLVLGSCATLSHAQVYHWQSSETLWKHALEVVPENGLAFLCLGDYLVSAKRYEEAITCFEQGLKLTHHEAANAYCDWGKCLVKLDRPVEAEQKFLEALKLNRNHEFALAELCKLLLKQKRFAEAAKVSAQYDRAFSRGQKGNPNDYRVEVDLGLRKVREGNLKEAIDHFEKAVQLSPRSAAALNNLASAQFDLRQFKEAKQNFLKALEVNPGLNGAHFSLAVILEAEQDFEGARQHYAEAYQINPQDLEAKQNMERLSKP